MDILRISDVDSSCECVYLCGNSLGLQPKTARTRVVEAMDCWAHRCVYVIFRNPVVLELCYSPYPMQGREGAHCWIKPMASYRGLCDYRQCSDGGCQGS